MGLAAAGLLFLAACSDPDTADDAGNGFDETVEDAVDAVEESGDEARGWIEDERDDDDDVQREEEENEEQYEDDYYDEHRDGNPIRFD
ncbi:MULTISPECIES: hypothetical protein [Thioalkalivibrio]|uniref:hypothetical protein n=1 Tax=Thioalkalivibrio TaxID=106633 RepID=UPI000380DB35|nr:MULTISPECIES: hypothetical protein [Thioalkalivibrio]